MHRPRRPAHSLTLALIALGSGCASTEAELPEDLQPVEIEWIYDAQREDVGDLPRTHWRSDGKALVLDPRVPEELRTFEVLDPSVGTRERLVDVASATATMRSWLKESAPESIEWPLSFDAAGERALYLYEGDVFVLELERSTFRRITETPEEETSPSFSPDGTHVAFVRENDLWVSRLEDRLETRLTTTGTDTLLNGTLSWVYWEEIFGQPRHRLLVVAGLLRRSRSSRADESAGGARSSSRTSSPRSREVIRQRYPKAGEHEPDRCAPAIVPVDRDHDPDVGAARPAELRVPRARQVAARQSRQASRCRR